MLVLVMMPLHSAQAQLSTKQRLERLELRVEKITELTLQLDAMRRENRELRGEIEVLQHTIETLQQKQRDLYLDVDQRLSQLQSAPSGATVPDAVQPTGAVDDATGAAPQPRRPATSDPAKAEADYQAAYDMLRPEQRRYGEAIAAFRVFLETYPDHQLAANAQYWLAEASYVTQDNATALVEFQKVVDLYPASLKVPGAMLKIGYIEHTAGNIDKAQQVLNQVVERYAGSASADMARQRLQRIAREAR